MEQLKAKLAELKGIASSFGESKGQITDALKGNKDNASKGNYEAVSGAFERIRAVQQLRIENQTKMNEILKDILALLDGVEIPADSDSSSSSESSSSSSESSSSSSSSSESSSSEASAV
jgi:hypothetical protein